MLARSESIKFIKPGRKFTPNSRTSSKSRLKLPTGLEGPGIRRTPRKTLQFTIFWEKNIRKESVWVCLNVAARLFSSKIHSPRTSTAITGVTRQRTT